MSIVEERYSKWLNHENLAPQYNGGIQKEYHIAF